MLTGDLVLALLTFLKFVDLLLIGGNGKTALGGVQNGVDPLQGVGVKYSDTYQGRDPHSARKNRGVGVWGASKGDKAQDQLLLQGDGLGGTQIVGDQNIGLCFFLHTVVCSSREVVQEPLGNILHIRHARREVGIVQLRKHIDIFLRRVPYSFLGRAATGKLVFQTILKILVLQKHGVDLKDLRFFWSDLGFGATV